MTTALGDTLTHSYDGLRRLSSVTNGLLTRQYSYRDISDNLTTMQVSRVRYPEFNYNFDYTYDALGNIATYDSPWANPVTYTYDNQSQLLSASDGTTTYTYTYDAAGNIQSASNGSTTHSYTYGDADWKDLLTAFDGQSITYDASGNPTSYYNGKRWTMSWVNGRQLASASDGTGTYSYIYDAAGSRIMKNVGTVNHLYFYVNGMLLMEYRYNAMGDTTDVLQYFYDANGKPHAMAYNGTVYLYVTNLQGDIVALLGLDGTVSGYEYDPYGNVVASYGDIAAINPLRYRGYYYDNETGLYYLQSRYYDPVVGRFINADSYASTGQGIIGFNMFAYCLNNPVMYLDFNGNDAVVLYDKDTLGHIGIMIEDCSGTWWHFYWGTQSGAAGSFTRIKCLVGCTVSQFSWCYEYPEDRILLNKINSTNQYGGDYERGKHIIPRGVVNSFELFASSKCPKLHYK